MGCCPKPRKGLFQKKSLDPQNFGKLVCATHRLGAEAPHNKNNALTPLVQARLGQGIIFIVCPAVKDRGAGGGVDYFSVRFINISAYKIRSA